MHLEEKMNPLSVLICKSTIDIVTMDNVSDGYNTFLNFYSYYIFRRIPENYLFFKNIYCDGVLLQKSLNLIGVKCSRQSFDMTSIAPELFTYASLNNKRVYIIGSEEQYISKFVEIIQGVYNFGDIQYRNGYFVDDNEKIDTIKTICEFCPDIVIVGMGTPAQDKFLFELYKFGWKGIAYTCGGFIHQVASGKLNYYPKFFDKFNLRWLYRMYDEPKLIKRYFCYYPLSMILFIYDFFRMKLTNEKN
ncbi:UDP-Gal:alpha-D-GlcNAc-diphosphoundecaprenol beta-1,4-galactosyltransferase [Klebsiella spallanzanii]|uniref:UDP-Gal:alpha-D-GlcNAc-diphosphoundecaprenol beta-1,4-galactosyltransferase n=1 Tax=Klebsiella spallanzanii TaxID=2587528 RepID=A0ABY6VDV6_9ENTR|nr:WecB/TagA/CpsF family glycosyltransferase [Klebsiella spallanzanii]VUS60307.1 UDP-Gal:alpha-D-GlcNAc-diphosphoundecaprenol beta-1,4-galactosyltransferase [Klebsiella spallanzanii]